MTPLTITSRDAATGPVLEITGDLDYTTELELRQALHKLTLDAGQLLVLDLSGLEFCDSSGISVFLAARNLAIEGGTVAERVGPGAAGTGPGQLSVSVGPVHGHTARLVASSHGPTNCAWRLSCPRSCVC
ncbi:STAS domain-containing protein [Streptomyces durmitorensis]|uniref:STAS domain-containing protein n=1 Tax=Streptomyces durmitorensis TaxID=319947 RepID=A0ABY4PJY0_9ACTN|nr:STAS domain-containing protein [Streptomyces durmitorensis]UQT53662.1 STAS domain-containing protein [Streptomyces durmitorensis]